MFIKKYKLIKNYTCVYIYTELIKLDKILVIARTIVTKKNLIKFNFLRLN